MIGRVQAIDKNYTTNFLQMNPLMKKQINNIFCLSSYSRCDQIIEVNVPEKDPRGT